MSRLIFHIDVNSAYLSWEAARRVANGESDLRLIPSAIQRGSSLQSKLDVGKKYKAQMEVHDDANRKT